MVNIAIIGIGYWGPNLVRNFIALKSVNIEQVCDIRAERLQFIQNRYPSIKGTSDYNDILGNERIEAIVLATPIETHYEMAKQAMLAGKHVFVEKPLCMTSSQAKHLRQIAEQKKRVQKPN